MLSCDELLNAFCGRVALEKQSINFKLCLSVIVLISILSICYKSCMFHGDNLYTVDGTPIGEKHTLYATAR